MFSIINIEYLNEENIVSNEVAKINESINLFYASDEYQTIISDNFEKTELKTQIIKFLAGKTETVGNAKSIITNLMNTKLLRNTEESLLVKFMDIINPTIQTFLGVESMPKLNTENMFAVDRISKISDFVQISLEYYNKIYKKDRELIDCVVESNYSELGSMLESMRNVELFKDYASTSGYYTTLMIGLDNKFGDYLDFEVATKSTFSWVETMNTYGNDLHSFLNYKLDNGAKMFDVISGKTELTFTEALSQMGTEKILDYYNKLKDCELIKPISQILYNEISSLIPTI